MMEAGRAMLLNLVVFTLFAVIIDLNTK